jgi:hypothetical protein
MIRAMQIVSIGFALVLTTSISSSKVHPLKMSFSKLVIGADGVVDLKTRIFLDDITAQMQNLYSLDSVDFSNVTSDGTKALEVYLTDHYYFEQVGKKSELRINAISFSKNRLAVEVHMSTENPLDASKELFLTNTLLCDADPKQKNDIIYLKEHLRLNLANPTTQIRLN